MRAPTPVGEKPCTIDKASVQRASGTPKRSARVLQRLHDVACLIDLIDDLPGNTAGEIIRILAAELVLKVLDQAGCRRAERFEVGVLVIERHTLAGAT